MKLRKYPVIAPSGREYEVEVTRSYACLGAYGYRFVAYRYEEVRGIFGKKRMKRVVKRSENYWEHSVIDVVYAAKDIVMACEQTIIDEEKRAASFAEFAKWDGRISG